MSLTKKLNNTKKLIAVLKNPEEHIIKWAAKRLIDRQQRTVRAGANLNKEVFPPYTERYAKKKGRSTPGGGTALHVSGDMLNAEYYTRRNKNSGLITIRADQMPKARGNHYGHRRGGKITNPRPFFKFDDETAKGFLLSAFRTALKNGVK
jgi:hypothetical protein